MAKLKVSPASKNRFAVYSAEKRFVKNKKNKLQRHLKNHPNDAQAEKALSVVGNLTKPSRSTHISSGVPEFKEITTTTIKNGKSVTIVERKIRISRLDKQLAKLIKRQVVFTDKLQKAQNELFKSLSLSQALSVMDARHKRLYQEKLEKLAAEGKLKEKPKSNKPVEKNKTGKSGKTSKKSK